MHTTLISTPDLAAQLTDPALVIVDCRFDLANADWGEQQYQSAVMHFVVSALAPCAGVSRTRAAGPA